MLIYRKKVFNKSLIRKIVDRSFFLLIFSIILYISFNYYEKFDKPSKTNNRYVGNVKNIEGGKTPLFNGRYTGGQREQQSRITIMWSFKDGFDGRNSRVPEFVLASYVGKIIYQGRNNTFRPDVAKTHRNTASKSGFTFVLLSIQGYFRPCKRHNEVLEILKRLRKRYPSDQRIYLDLDNFSPHRCANILQWARCNNVELVWTPTNASWQNRIECQFTEVKSSFSKTLSINTTMKVTDAMSKFLHYRNKRNGKYKQTLGNGTS